MATSLTELLKQQTANLDRLANIVAHQQEHIKTLSELVVIKNYEQHAEEIHANYDAFYDYRQQEGESCLTFIDAKLELQKKTMTRMNEIVIVMEIRRTLRETIRNHAEFKKDVVFNLQELRRTCQTIDAELERSAASPPPYCDRCEKEGHFRQQCPARRYY
jgi:hypothetical protein